MVKLLLRVNIPGMESVGMILPVDKKFLILRIYGQFEIKKLLYIHNMYIYLHSIYVFFIAVCTLHSAHRRQVLYNLPIPQQ